MPLVADTLSNEFHIYGPPGTGKTTTLSKNIGLAVEKHGPDRVMVSSFTKAAATEVIDRGVPVAKNMIGTLHSLCFRGLEDPVIAESKAKEFNEDNSHPYRITPHTKSGLDDIGEASSGASDDIMTQYQSLRARLIPREVWKPSVTAFAKRWEDFKQDGDYLDFTDLIEFARDKFSVAPGNPKVMFVDEAQDLNAMQMSCIRKWGENMERLILVGDDDQTIFKFAGADAANMLDRGVPDENKIILNQSYRVPRAVLAHVDPWIKQITQRQKKEYLPRDADGEVTYMDASWKTAEDIALVVEQDVVNGKSVMILGSAAYMLKPVIHELRGSGLLFHNPYRLTNGSWNPVRSGDGSVRNRILTFMRGDLSPTWSNHDLMIWIDLITAKGVLKHGAKAEIKRQAEAAPHQPADYRKYFEAPGPWESLDPWSAIPNEAVNWLARNASPTKSKGINYIKNAVIQRGKEYLHLAPKIVVGTIHSVKGGEADVVYLFPDLSPDAYDNGWDKGGDHQNDVIRMMYVGMTRAREKLVILEPAGPRAAPI